MSNYMTISEWMNYYRVHVICTDKITKEVVTSFWLSIVTQQPVTINSLVRTMGLPWCRKNSLFFTTCNICTLLISSCYEHLICIGNCSYVRGQLVLSFNYTS